MDRIRDMYNRIADNKKIIKTIAVIILIITAVLVFGLRTGDDTISLAKSQETETTVDEKAKVRETASASLFVDVSGEVKSPGVYEVEKDSRIFEAIEKAGGLTEKADTTSINQAEKVSDGQKITVPSRNDNVTQNTSSAGNTAAAGSSSSTQSTALININTADSAGLQEIPGVGPVTAEKIIDYRTQNGNFRKKEDIRNVSGIGDKTYAKMKNKITI